MADTPPEGDPQADPKDDPKDDPKKTPAGDDLEELKAQVKALTDTLAEQAKFLSKLSNLGGEPQKAQTEDERLEELEATIKVLTTKLEADAEAKRKAEQEEKEARIDRIITANPRLKEDREKLLKAPSNVLDIIDKASPPDTNLPYGRANAFERKDDEWKKKIAAATQRRLDKQASRASIRYK